MSKSSIDSQAIEKLLVSQLDILEPILSLRNSVNYALSKEDFFSQLIKNAASITSQSFIWLHDYDACRIYHPYKEKQFQQFIKGQNEKSVFKFLKAKNNPVNYHYISVDSLTLDPEQHFSSEELPILSSRYSLALALDIEANLVSEEFSNRIQQALYHQISLAISRYEDLKNRTSKERQFLISSLPMAVLLLDEQNRILLSNPKAEKILEYAAIVGNNLQLNSVFGTEFDVILNARYESIYTFSGKEYLVQISIFEEDLHVEKLVIINEITKERQVQKQQDNRQRLESIGQLSAGIAHDFNNILTGIIGYAEYLGMQDDIDTKYQSFIKGIIQSSHRAANLVQQILDFSRNSEQTKSLLDLLPFLKEFHKLLQRSLPENIRFDFVHKNTSYYAYFNPTQIQQVIMNLVINARDAIEENGRIVMQLKLLAESEKPPDAAVPIDKSLDYYHLTISDNGCGMDDAVLDRLFEPFYTTKPLGEGTGLGMSQVYGLLQQHNAKIHIESKPGNGSLVSIYIPAVLRQGELDLGTAIPMGNGEKVILIEDEQEVLDVEAFMLKQLGYTVKACSTADEAYAYFRVNTDASIVISDFILPDCSGKQIYKKLLEFQRPFQFIILSGYAKSSSIQEYIQEQNIQWLAKPIDLHVLADTLQKLLSKEDLSE